MDFLKDGIIVIDDFYEEPEKVRSFGLSQEYSTHEGQNFPGYQSTNLHLQNLKEKFQKIVSAQKISMDEVKWVFGAFRTASKEAKGRSHVHFDEPDWSAVIYLTKLSENDLVTGTSFFRHKKTRLLGPCQDIKRQRPWEEIRDFGTGIINNQTHDLSAWEKIKEIPYKYNRLVCFRGRNLFHAPGPGFGVNRESARLTQHFFFDAD